jgi:hypothetical protein
MQRSISLIVSPGFSLEDLAVELGADKRFNLSMDYDDFTIRRREAPSKYVFFTCDRSLQNLAIDDYKDNSELNPGFREVVSERVVYALLSDSVLLLRDVLDSAGPHGRALSGCLDG